MAFSPPEEHKLLKCPFCSNAVTLDAVQVAALVSDCRSHVDTTVWDGSVGGCDRYVREQEDNFEDFRKDHGQVLAPISVRITCSCPKCSRRLILGIREVSTGIEATWLEPKKDEFLPSRVQPVKPILLPFSSNSVYTKVPVDFGGQK